MRTQSTPTEKTIGIHFGALCDPIEKQLKDQEVILSENDCECFQKIANAITILHLHHILPDSIVYKSHQKLMKKISDAIHKEKKP